MQLHERTVKKFKYNLKLEISLQVSRFSLDVRRSYRANKEKLRGQSKETRAARVQATLRRCYTHNLYISQEATARLRNFAIPLTRRAPSRPLISRLNLSICELPARRRDVDSRSPTDDRLPRLQLRNRRTSNVHRISVRNQRNPPRRSGFTRA